MSENSRQQHAELNPRAAKIVAKRAEYSEEKTTSQQTVEERNDDARDALKNKENSVVTAVEKEAPANAGENKEDTPNTPAPIATDDYTGLEDDDRSEQETTPVLAALGAENKEDITEAQPFAHKSPDKTKITVENSFTGRGGVTVRSDGNQDEIIIETTGNGTPQELNKIGKEALRNEVTGVYNDGTEKTLHMLGASLNTSTNNAPLSQNEKSQIDQHLKFSPAPGVEISSIMKDKLARDVVDPASKEQNLTRHASGYDAAEPYAEKSLAELEANLEAERRKKRASFEEIRKIKEEMDKRGRDMNEERHASGFY